MIDKYGTQILDRDYIVNGTLASYLERFNGIVKMFKSDRREGLIRARTLGGKHATGSILVYLDAHCEPMKNWLAPLITPIAQVNFGKIRKFRCLRQLQ